MDWNLLITVIIVQKICLGDGLHLNDDSRVILANILARETKNFAVALVRIIFYVKQLSITTMKSLPISQTVLK